MNTPNVDMYSEEGVENEVEDASTNDADDLTNQFEDDNEEQIRSENDDEENDEEDEEDNTEEEDHDTNKYADSHASDDKLTHKKIVKVKRTFQEKLPKPKQAIHELFIRLPGCGKDKQRVSVRAFPWPRSFEQRYRKQLAQLRRDNILRSLANDKEAREEFLEQEKRKKSKKKSVNMNDYSSDNETQNDESNDESDISEEEEEEEADAEEEDDQEEDNSISNKKEKMEQPTFWLPFLLSNDTFYLERVLSVMFGWIVSPSPLQVSSTSLRRQISEEEEEEEQETSVNELLAHASSEKNGTEHSSEDDEMKTATFHELTPSSVELAINNNNSNSNNNDENVNDKNGSSKNHNDVHNSSNSNDDNESSGNGQSPNINENLTSTVRYSQSTEKKKAKHNHKSLLTRIPRFDDCNHLFYLVKENRSGEWHLLDVHPSTYMKYASHIQQRIKQAKLEKEQSKVSKSFQTNNSQTRRDDENESDEEEEDEEEEEEEEEVSDVDEEDAQDKNASDSDVNNHDNIDNNSLDSISSTLYDLQSVIIIDTMMLAALTSPMGLHYCLLQTCQLSLEQVQRWIDLDPEVGYMLLSSIYVVLRGIRANDEPRLQYTLPALELDFNQFFRSDFLQFCDKSTEAMQSNNELDYGASTSSSATTTINNGSTINKDKSTTLTLTAVAAPSLSSSSSTSSLLQIGNELTAMNIMSKAGLSLFWADSNVPSRQLHYVTTHSVLKLRWTMEALLQARVVPSKPIELQYLNNIENVQLVLWLMMAMPANLVLSWNEEWPLKEKIALERQYKRDARLRQRQFGESVSDNEETDNDDDNLHPHTDNDDDEESEEEEEEWFEEEELEDEQYSNAHSTMKKLKWEHLTNNEVERRILKQNKRVCRREAKERALVQFRYVDWPLLFLPSNLLMHCVLEIRRRLERENNGNAPSQFTLHETLEPFLRYECVENNNRNGDPIVTSQLILEQVVLESHSQTHGIANTNNNNKEKNVVSNTNATSVTRHQKLYQSDMVLLLLALTNTLPPRERLSLHKTTKNTYNNNNYRNGSNNNYFLDDDVSTNTGNKSNLSSNSSSGNINLKSMSSSVNVRRKSYEQHSTHAMNGAHLHIFSELLNAKLRKHVMPLHRTRSATLRVLFHALPRFREVVMMRELCNQAPLYELFGCHEPCPLHSMLHSWGMEGKDGIPPQCIDVFVNTFWHELYYRFSKQHYDEAIMQYIKENFNIIVDKVNERFYQYRSNLSLLGGQLHRHSTVHYGTNRSIRKNSINLYILPSNLHKSTCAVNHQNSLSLNKPFRASLSTVTEVNPLNLNIPMIPITNVNSSQTQVSSTSQISLDHMTCVAVNYNNSNSNNHSSNQARHIPLSSNSQSLEPIVQPPSPQQQSYELENYGCLQEFEIPAISLLHPSRFGGEFKAEWLRVSALFEALPMTERSYYIPETLYLLLFEVEEVDTVAIRYLLDKGVTTVRSNPFTQAATPALEYALQNKNFEVAQLLVGLGASLEDSVMHGSMTMRTFAEQQLLPSQMKQLRMTASANKQTLRADMEYMYGVIRPIAGASV